MNQRLLIKNRMVSLTLLMCFISFTGLTQDLDRKIEFPHVPGYLTLKCDFHIHTVFSDGSVWPNIRIDEAVRDGLDAISLTEHIEYQPHEEDIPHPDRNRSYNLALEYAKPHDLLIVHGAEITKDLPPGHANALFITDANLLNHEDPLTAYRAAAAQGAFVFWNHPNWIQQQEDGLPVVTPFHETLIKEGLLHGIEVVNDLTYSERALELTKEHNLTVMGTSDIHGLVDWQYGLANGGHRPIALVFARERSVASIKEALMAGRSVAWFNDILIGKEEHLVPLIQSSLRLTSRGFIGPSTVEEILISNNSDAAYLLQSNDQFEFYNQSDIITIPPHETTLVQVLTGDAGSVGSLSVKVLSAVSGVGQHPVVALNVNR